MNNTRILPIALLLTIPCALLAMDEKRLSTPKERAERKEKIALQKKRLAERKNKKHDSDSEKEKSDSKRGFLGKIGCVISRQFFQVQGIQTKCQRMFLRYKKIGLENMPDKRKTGEKNPFSYMVQIFMPRVVAFDGLPYCF